MARQTDVSELARPYWNFRDELSVLDGVLLKGNCIVSKSVRNDVLSQIHEGHMDMSKCRLRAWTSVYWPSINGEIEDIVRQCEMCQLSKPKNQKEPLISAAIPSTHWTKIDVDLCELNKKHYLVLIGYNSKFPIVREIQDEISSVVIQSIKGVLSEFGSIKELVSDNEPCFRSHEFNKFVKMYGITHVTISQHHHQSNCQVERCIRTIKVLLKKNAGPWMSLLTWR